MRFTFPQLRSRFTVGLELFSSVSSTILLLGMLAVSVHARADANEATRLTDMRLRALLQATSPQELKEANARTERIKIGRIECEMQLKGRRVPSKCFEVLKDESALGLIANAPKQSQEEWLTKLCKKRAQSSNDLRELNRLIELDFVPRSCHDEVVSRALDLKYASEAEDPSSLFTDRFQQVAAEEPSRPESGQAARKLQVTQPKQLRALGIPIAEHEP